MSQSVPRRTLLLVLALAAAACTRPPPPDGMLPPPPPPQTVAAPLVTSLQVETGDTVALSLQVTNTTGGPVTFTFPSGQTFDFVVRPAGAEGELWRWSADKGFTQAVQTLTLGPGETWTFGARWTPPPGARGQFTAAGRLVSSDRPVETAATFTLP
ncbi:MAG TPA: BsuPI-related putative proteinase inhibitor [Longimicrobium sp.]|nr:BsuPI-related putative proteinase inhibitor [Longimicrobium sp.]